MLRDLCTGSMVTPEGDWMAGTLDHDLGGRVQQIELQHVAYLTAIRELREHYDSLLQGVLTAVKQPPHVAAATVQEWVPLKVLVTIAAGIIALLVSGVLTLTSSWSTTQNV